MKALHHLWVIAALAIPCRADTLYVNGVRGNDAWDGGSRTRTGEHGPFRSLARAVSALEPGDTLILAPQLYRESLFIKTGGTPESPIIIDGSGAQLEGADPVPPEIWQPQSDGPFSARAPRQVRAVWSRGRALSKAKSRDAIQSEQWWWEDGAFLFRPSGDRSPREYDLRLSVRDSGVKFDGARYVIVRNLTCRHFWNDGFNIHGGSAPVWFENIVGEENGDEGFSAHDNAEVYVRNGEFARNFWHGIADVNYARSHYAGIRVFDNGQKGILFIGGFHSVTGAQVYGHPVNIAVRPGGLKTFPFADGHPLAPAVVHLRDVTASEAGDYSLHVDAGASISAEHCRLEGGQRVIGVKGTLYIINSIIRKGREWEVMGSGKWIADYNVYHPGRFWLGEHGCGPDQWEEYRRLTANDAHSVLSQDASAVRAFGGHRLGGVEPGPGS